MEDLWAFRIRGPMGFQNFVVILIYYFNLLIRKIAASTEPITKLCIIIINEKLNNDSISLIYLIIDYKMLMY